jgi:hypothetical protein
MNKGMTDMTSTSIDHLFGCIRISEEGAYYDGKFTIETFGYWNLPEPAWAMPAWDERGFPEFATHFDTYDAAYKAIKNSGWDMDRVV